MKLFSSIFICLMLIFTLTGCKKEVSEETVTETVKTKVSVHTVAESSNLAINLVSPGTVTPEQDVKVTASASGTASGVTVNLGDTVRAGQILLRIDDANSGGAASFNANQVAQAQLAVNQAKTALDLAKRNYDSLQSSTKQDLEQAKTSSDQANRNIEHTNTTTDESIKTAELAYQTSKLATEQVQNNLDNRKTLAEQAENDARTNGMTASNTYAATAGSVIDNINAITGFDDRNIVVVNYSQYLGALDSDARKLADNNYDEARKAYNVYQATPACTETIECLDRTYSLLSTTKLAIDATVNMLEKTITGSELPQASSMGVSLTSLKTAGVGYQSQINAAMSAINGAKQALNNILLNNKTSLVQLEKAYHLSINQEEAALQNVNNLRAQIESQKDQIQTGASMSQIAYEGLNIKIQSQLDISSVQVEQAESAYQNALLALNNLSNLRVITAPIDGKITQKSVVVGDSVGPGQVLFTISKTGNVKVEMYTDVNVHKTLKAGDKAEIVDSNKQIFPVKIMRIAPEADALTKRFLVELFPDGVQPLFPGAGSIVDVKMSVQYIPLEANNFFVPLFAITMGQNESSIFVIKEGLATRVIVNVIRVMGEYAEISADIPPETVIIFDGARTVSEGEQVEPIEIIKE